MFDRNISAPALCSLAIMSCATPAHNQEKTMPTHPSSALLAPWSGPLGGVPPFDKVKVGDFEPALELGMADQLKEIEAIANDASPPSFENTLAALERTGQPLGRAQSIFAVWAGTMSTPEFRAVEQKMAPRMAAFSDQIVQNAKLFARIKAVYDARETSNLSPEQKRLVWLTYHNFVRQGASLDADKKAQLSEINQSLARLYTKFAQNQLGDEETYALVVENKADLAGLPDSQIAAAAAEAERRGQKGKWIFSNTRSAMEPFLTYASTRAQREKAFRMWVSRGDNAGDRDNNPLVREILLLRAKKAKLLGYPTYAHWHLADTMAKEPERAMKLMLSVWKPASEQFRKDVLEAQAIANKEHGHVAIEPWDYRYYAEKLRKAKYNLDMNEVKPYLQLDHLREAMFWAAGQLYGFSFKKLDGIPVYHPDVTVYEVTRGGGHVGYWYFDPYARPGKQSGAWMSAYREQQRLIGDIPTIVSNNSNFIKGGAGEPVTVSWDDAKTMFHEFGHALHGLNSNVTYPSLSGTNTAADFVEFPSQFNENYLATPEVLKFFVNAKGEPIPAALVARIQKAEKFNQGFFTAEAQASAIVDMKMHLAGETPIDAKEFEKTTLAEIGMPKQMVMRHRIPAFGHVFSGEGYAAGYYGYLWAEVLEHDAFEAFKEAGGPYDKTVANRLQQTVMGVGNTVDPAEAFRNFRGRDPQPDALLRYKGFTVPTTK